MGALVLASVGVTACGDDDESPDSGASSAQTQGTATSAEQIQREREKQAAGPALGGDREQARAGVAAVDEVYDDFGAAVDDGIAAVDVPVRDVLERASDDERLANVCDLMSEEAKQQTIEYAKRSAGLADVTWTCENATGLLLRRTRQTGGLKRSLKAEVVGVNVDGDRATASIRFGGKGPISAVPLVKEDGQWKLAASPSGGGDDG